ncbi:hypothetical protein BXZ70DRAFT_562583 [Cristinia sonorae]|uniref:Uncharacterized protein n=1 Tax=Cristinia sonorae TaxID=1940300 RepID=A0A8K0XL43_9AGAR|nr:hypothetical protein BXZ70DRAFT_562583 [Cristinia sonorae]
MSRLMERRKLPTSTLPILRLSVPLLFAKPAPDPRGVLRDCREYKDVSKIATKLTTLSRVSRASYSNLNSRPFLSPLLVPPFLPMRHLLKSPFDAGRQTSVISRLWQAVPRLLLPTLTPPDEHDWWTRDSNMSRYVKHPTSCTASHHPCRSSRRCARCNLPLPNAVMINEQNLTGALFSVRTIVRFEREKERYFHGDMSRPHEVCRLRRI